MRSWVDAECERKLPVALEASALIVASECLLQVAVAGAGGSAAGLLLNPLAVAGHEDLGLARAVLFAWEGRVAWLRARVPTPLLLPARLPAGALHILTPAWPVARHLAPVRAAAQLPATDLAAARLCEPARLVLEHVFAA